MRTKRTKELAVSWAGINALRLFFLGILELLLVRKERKVWYLLIVLSLLIKENRAWFLLIFLYTNYICSIPANNSLQVCFSFFT